MLNKLRFSFFMLPTVGACNSYLKQNNLSSRVEPSELAYKGVKDLKNALLFILSSHVTETLGTAMVSPLFSLSVTRVPLMPIYLGLACLIASGSTSVYGRYKIGESIADCAQGGFR